MKTIFRANFSRHIAPYFALTKPRLTLLVIVSTAVGYLAAAKGMDLQASHFGWVLFSTTLVASGAMSLNQWMEYKQDRMMQRTALRPVASGKLTPKSAFVFGCVLAFFGCELLFLAGHPLSAVLAFVTFALYLFFYTPLKQESPFSTLVGALPGALPPLIGWSAVEGKLPFEAWLLASIVFFWQFPHFFSIGWLCREEYKQARFPMLFVLDPRFEVTESVIKKATLFMVLTSEIYFFQRKEIFGFFAAMVLGGLFIALVYRRNALMPEKKMRAIFHYSLLYLFVLFLVVIGVSLQ